MFDSSARSGQSLFARAIAAAATLAILLAHGASNGAPSERPMS